MVNGIKAFFGVVLVGLFALAMINYGIDFAQDNNLNQSILDDDRIAPFRDELNSTLVNKSAKSTALKESFVFTNPVAVVFGVIIEGIVGVGNTIVDTIIVFNNIIFGFAFEVLGIPPVAISTVFGILVILMLLYLYRLYRSGEP